MINDVAVLAVQNGGSYFPLRIIFEVGSVTDHFAEIRVYVPGLWQRRRWWLKPLGAFFYLVGQLKGYLYIKRRLWGGMSPDVCHVNVLTRAAGLPWLLWKTKGIPYVISEHWTRYGRENSFPYGKLHGLISKLFVKDAACLCPVSCNLLESMKSQGLVNRRAEIVGNVVDTDVFYNTKKPHTDIVQFVHVSFLKDYQKNISGVLRALSSVNRFLDNWRLVIVGDGIDRDVLLELPEKLGLSSQVEFVMMKQERELAEILRASDCLLMFSRFENQPVSMLEALACGLPVIGTDVGDIPRLLSDGRGVCVKSEDENALADAILNIVAQRGEENTAEIENRVRYISENHSMAVISRKFDAIYQSVCPQL